MNELTIAYLAGIIDGEGCVSIQRGKNPSNKYAYYSPVLSVNMVDEKPIKLLESTFGGTSSLRQSVGIGRKAQWRWSLPISSMVEVLQLLLPYLQVKEKQALLVINFCLNWENHSKVKGIWRTKGIIVCSPEVVSERERYYSKMKELNT